MHASRGSITINITDKRGLPQGLAAETAQCCRHPPMSECRASPRSCESRQEWLQSTKGDGDRQQETMTGNWRVRDDDCHNSSIDADPRRLTCLGESWYQSPTWSSTLSFFSLFAIINQYILSLAAAATTTRRSNKQESACFTVALCYAARIRMTCAC
jgi:hypothetical protein